MAIIKDVAEDYDLMDPLEQRALIPTFIPADVPALIPAYTGPCLTTAPPVAEVDKGKGRALTPEPPAYPPDFFPLGHSASASWAFWLSWQ
jgi:hypothetical protein